jgi:hypothetical protein
LEQNIPKKQGDSFIAPLARSREKADHEIHPGIFKEDRNEFQDEVSPWWAEAKEAGTCIFFLLGAAELSSVETVMASAQFSHNTG